MPVVRPRLARLSVLSVLLMAACTERTPIAPTPLTPPNAITITAPAAFVLVGSMVPLSATGTFSDGLSRPLSPKWIVDNPAVAVVDEQGRLRGLANGVATIVGVQSGVSGSIELRVIPDYRGAWLGSLRQISCVHWDFRGCGRTFPSNATFTLRLDLQQTRTSVSGGFDLDTLPPALSMASRRRDLASLSGTVADDGTLILEGPVLRDGAPTTTTIYRWRSRIAADGSMTGGFTYLTPITNFDLYPLVVEFDLMGLRRTP
jgi:hypothetical protein